MLKFMEIKFHDTEINQKQKAKEMGFSDSTFERYRNDISKDSPYNRNKTKKNSRGPMTSCHVKNGVEHHIRFVNAGK